MGMFDTITFSCPDCGTEMSGQSKSGDCILDTYHHTSVPIDVALDANRHAPFECECGSSWYFDNVPRVPEKCSLTIKKGDEDNGWI